MEIEDKSKSKRNNSLTLTALKPTVYKKGQSGNPSGQKRGRKVGYKARKTVNFRNLRALASEKYEEAFEMLWENMQNNQKWAHYLYFNVLVPRKAYMPTVVIDPVAGETRSEAVIKALECFKELTYEEILNEIKIFKNIEFSDTIKQAIETAEEKEIRLQHIKDYIRWKNETAEIEESEKTQEI